MRIVWASSSRGLSVFHTLREQLEARGRRVCHATVVIYRRCAESSDEASLERAGDPAQDVSRKEPQIRRTSDDDVGRGETVRATSACGPNLHGAGRDVRKPITALLAKSLESTGLILIDMKKV